MAEVRGSLFDTFLRKWEQVQAYGEAGSRAVGREEDEYKNSPFVVNSGPPGESVS